MSKFWRILRHEYWRHVLRWRFLFALLSVPLWLVFMLAMMAISIMVQFDRTPVGYVDQAGLIQVTTLPEETGLSFINAPLVSFESEEAARAALKAKQVQAYYVLPADFRKTRSARLVYRSEAPGAAASQFTSLVRLNLLAGQPENVAWRVTDGASLSFQTVGGSGKRSANSAAAASAAALDAGTGSQGANTGDGGLAEIMKMAAPIAAAVFLFAAVLTSSGYLMQAVVDEKENRTMEILVTSASPAIIMNAKIAGLICVGLTQMLFWAGPPVALLLIAQASLPALALPALGGGMVALLVCTTLPTFVMISALMAAVGASVTEAREGQQVMSLFNLLLMSPFIVAVSILARPDGPIALALSFFPLTASLTLLMRASFSTVPAWQSALSIALLVLSAAGALWLAGRVFRLGMLNYGKRLGWRDVFRGIRHGAASSAGTTAPREEGAR